MIFILKILPAIMASSYVLNFISVFFGYGSHVIITFIGMIAAPLIFMYMASYVFKFCEYPRLFIHYVLIIEILTTAKWYFPVIVTSSLVFNLSMLLSGLLLVTVLIRHAVKFYKKKRRT